MSNENHACSSEEAMPGVTHRASRGGLPCARVTISFGIVPVSSFSASNLREAVKNAIWDAQIIVYVTHPCCLDSCERWNEMPRRASHRFVMYFIALHSAGMEPTSSLSDAFLNNRRQCIAVRNALWNSSHSFHSVICLPSGM